MGVESDRLVFDYLSRVGDLAQTALPAADRMRLVAQLRRDIDQQRGEGDTPASVERLLGRIGSPDEVVEAAASSAPAPRRAEAPPPAEPPPGSYGPYTRPAAPPAARPRAGTAVTVRKAVTGRPEWAARPARSPTSASGRAGTEQPAPTARRRRASASARPRTAPPATGGRRPRGPGRWPGRS
ncbi:hypothetical protein [Actinacidiphila yeochonensis]|uniref:hypothetical protein n=1 Tax=Actinacidiphila yeochonensis TaxID=89050 RepID=UPI00068FC057|nr:hypothetical protein [Actinacidiphila yeochonensis]